MATEHPYVTLDYGHWTGGFLIFVIAPTTFWLVLLFGGGPTRKLGKLRARRLEMAVKHTQLDQHLDSSPEINARHRRRPPAAQCTRIKSTKEIPKAIAVKARLARHAQKRQRIAQKCFFAYLSLMLATSFSQDKTNNSVFWF